MENITPGICIFVSVGFLLAFYFGYKIGEAGYKIGEAEGKLKDFEKRLNYD